MANPLSNHWRSAGSVEHDNVVLGASWGLEDDLDTLHDASAGYAGEMTPAVACSRWNNDAVYRDLHRAGEDQTSDRLLEFGAQDSASGEVLVLLVQ